MQTCCVGKHLWPNGRETGCTTKAMSCQRRQGSQKQLCTKRCSSFLHKLPSKPQTCICSASVPKATDFSLSCEEKIASKLNCHCKDLDLESIRSSKKRKRAGGQKDKEQSALQLSWLCVKSIKFDVFKDADCPA